jgi:hypothetical protein
MVVLVTCFCEVGLLVVEYKPERELVCSQDVGLSFRHN